MNISKFVMTFCLVTVFMHVGWSQKTNTKTSASVSQLIATNASSEEILGAWEDLVLQKQLKSYSEVEQLVEQTMQIAYLNGNKQLGASITKTAYYSTLTNTLAQDVAAVKIAIQNTATPNLTEKNFKLEPDARDLQRTAIGKIDLETQRKLRFNLVNKAQSVLAYVPGIEINNSTVTGKNQRQAILPDVFETSDVILSNGSTITTKDQLKAYLKRLETAYITANTDLKTSGSQLYSIMLTQQQVAQNETTLTNKLLKKGASMID